MLSIPGVVPRRANGVPAGDEQVVLIRADAGRMGTGHVMRCLALAHAWQKTGGRVAFALATAPATVEARLAADRVAIHRITALPGSTADAAQTVAIAHRLGARRVVVDGYHFDVRFQRAVKAADLALLLVDDYGHAAAYLADLVLNQNLHADEASYRKREAYTHLLLGTRYALLRQEFLQWRDWTRPMRPRTRRVLVTLGGTDPDNATATVIRALRLLDPRKLEVRVAVGPASAHRDALLDDVAGARCAMQVLEGVSDMPALMAWADVAVSAAGSTCWELAFMGAPVVLIVLAEHQRAIAASLVRAGMAVDAGWHRQLSEDALAGAVDGLLSTPQVRRQMSSRARALVDGQGARRVATCLSAVGA